MRAKDALECSRERPRAIPTSSTVRLRTFGGLWIENSGAATGPRPRPLALLAILAASSKGTSRDHLLGVLWPETEPERARHALSQAVYSLRRDLGNDVLVSTPGLLLDPSRMSSDIADFRAAVRAKNWTEAAALYVGPFLSGFYLVDAPEFERWVESERAALAADGYRAIERLALECAEQGRAVDAIELRRRLTVLEPLSTRFAISYIEALVAQGERAEALAHGKTHADLLRREFEAQPDPEILRLMAALRDPGGSITPATGRLDHADLPTTTVASEGHAAADDPPPPPAPGAPQPPSVSPRRRHGARRSTLMAVAALTLSSIAVIKWRAVPVVSDVRPILAVGRIRDVEAPDSAGLGGVLSDMLATSLGRVSGLQIVANSRMVELAPRNTDTSRTLLNDVARRAGATEVIEGELIPMPGQRLRLDVRRVEIAHGRVRGAYQLTGRDRIALFDSVTVLIAADLQLGGPTASLAAVSTASPVAYRLYEDGLRAFYQNDFFTAYRLFRGAVHEDSTFAMATYYAWRSAVVTGNSAQESLAERSLQLASKASERDRLLVETHVGARKFDVRAAVAAESLAARYPRDPEALMRAGEVILDLGRATALLNRAISLDSATGMQSLAICHLCDALDVLINRYLWADSVAAVERTMQRWRALRPEDPQPWLRLALTHINLGHRAEADAALRKAEALGAPEHASSEFGLMLALTTSDVDGAASYCSSGLASPDTATFMNYRWFCTIALRMAGRYRDAFALNQEGRIPGTALVRRGMPQDPFIPAILDMETGRGLVAANEFAALVPKIRRGLPLSMQARDKAWYLTLTATAAVAGGDTLRARRLIDSIEAIGSRSLFARDPLLHHFVRGLLLEREHQNLAAAREFQLSIASPTNGYTRANYELARILLAQHRQAEAIPLMRAVLHGGLEGSGLYLTRTETHELLAQLFDAGGQTDSAAAHYRVVERAWRNADPFLQARYVAARQWLERVDRLARR